MSVEWLMGGGRPIVWLNPPRQTDPVLESEEVLALLDANWTWDEDGWLVSPNGDERWDPRSGTSPDPDDTPGGSGSLFDASKMVTEFDYETDWPVNWSGNRANMDTLIGMMINDNNVGLLLPDPVIAYLTDLVVNEMWADHSQGRGPRPLGYKGSFSPQQVFGNEIWVSTMDHHSSGQAALPTYINFWDEETETPSIWTNGLFGWERQPSEYGARAPYDANLIEEGNLAFNEAGGFHYLINETQQQRDRRGQPGLSDEQIAGRAPMPRPSSTFVRPEPVQQQYAIFDANGEQLGPWMNTPRAVSPRGTMLPTRSQFQTGGTGPQFRYQKPQNAWTRRSLNEYSDRYRKTLASRKYPGGGFQPKFAVDERKLRERGKDLWRAYLREEPNDSQLREWVRIFAGEAEGMWRRGGTLDFDAFMKGRIRSTSRYSHIYNRKPEGLDELEWMREYDQVMKAIGVPERLQNPYSVRAANQGQSSLGFASRASRSADVRDVNTYNFAAQFANSIRGSLLGSSTGSRRFDG